VDKGTPGATDDPFLVEKALYAKKSAGCGMKGSQTAAWGNPPVTLKYDLPTTQNLWISFNTSAITGTVDANFLRTQILANMSYAIGQTADASAVVAYVKGIAPNVSVSADGVSGDGVTYTATLAPTGVNYRFALASTRIIIDGTPGT
jgi:hypothetical protein